MTAGEGKSFDEWGERVEIALRDSNIELAHCAADHACAIALTPRELLRASLWRARCNYMNDDLELALPIALQAVASSQLMCDLGLQAESHTLVARILRLAGDSEGALRHALAAVRLLDSAEPEYADNLLRVRMQAQTALALVYLNLRTLNSALEHCQQAVECARALGDRNAIGIGLDTLACVQGGLAELEGTEGRVVERMLWFRGAIENSTEALSIARAEGHHGNEATALHNMVEAMIGIGEATEALPLLEEWLRQNVEALPRLQAHHAVTRGSLYMSLGRLHEARHWFEDALSKSSNNLMGQLTALPLLSQVLERQEDWRAALFHYKSFHDLQARFSAESAQRSARITAVMLETERAQARAEMLSRRNEDLQRLSGEDPLTGLINRRSLDQMLARDSKSYCVALIDVDNFKQVNDVYSHAVGDAVLRRLADLLRQGCRANDTPARLGGEEFVALLQTEVPTQAQAVTERLRRLVADSEWGNIAAGLRITISIGVAHPHEAGGSAALMALADRRMYLAKRRGRNQVVWEG